MRWATSSKITLGVAALVLLGCGGGSEESLLADAKSAIAKGDLKTAVVSLRAVLEKNERSDEARLLLGGVFHDTGDQRSAEIELRKVLAHNYQPDRAVPLFANVLLVEQQYGKILEELSSTKLTDQAAQANLSAALAASYAATGDTAHAIEIVSNASVDQPENTALLILKARLFATKGDYDSALALLEKLVAAHPKELAAWKLRGSLYLAGKNDHVQARKSYQEVLAIQPKDLRAHSEMIDMAMSEGDKVGAKKQYDALVQVLPKHPETKYIGAKLAFADGKFDQTREMTSQLLQQVQGNARLWTLSGAAQLRLGALFRAEADFSKALALDPGSSEARRLLVETNLRNGQATAALNNLAPLLKSGMADVVAMNFAAEAHLMLGEVERATSYFKQLEILKPDDVNVRTALAVTEFGRGKSEAALAELKVLATKTPEVFPDLTLINLRLRAGDVNGALATAEAMERKIPDKPLAAELRGRILSLKRDYAAARKAFEQALSRDPMFMPAVTKLAAMDLAEGQLAAARTRYEAVLQRDAKNVIAMVGLAELKARTGGKREEVEHLLAQAEAARPQEVAARVAHAEYLMRLGDSKQALVVAQAGVAAAPDSGALLDVLGRAQMAAGDANQAGASFARWASLQPNAVTPHLRISNARMQTNDVAGGEAGLKRALEIDPSNALAQSELINFATRFSQLDRALQLAKNVQKQRPAEATGYLLEGNLHQAMKAWDAAISAYKAGLGHIKSTQLAVKLHAALAAAGRTQEANAQSEEWLKQNPKDAIFRAHLGELAIAAQDYAKAESHFQAAVTLDSRNASNLNNLAWVMAKGKRAGAVDMAKRAADSTPDNPAVLDTLAYALMQEGRTNQAIETLKNAVALAPDEPNYRLDLARLYVRGNDKASAKSQLIGLQQMGAAFARQQEVDELLRGL